jgi:Mg/Co/Ni transporter MgtE
MSYTMADFRRDYVLEHFKDLTPEERRQAFEALPAEERQKVVEGLSSEERRKVIEGLSAKERLEGLSPEEIEALLRDLKAGRPSRPRKPRGKR